MDDKRKYARCNKDVFIDFRLINSLDEYQLGVSENISESGIMFETVSGNRELKAGQYVEMDFKGPAPGQAFKVLGEIVWTKRLRFTLKTKLGIKLVFLSAEDVEKVKQLLK